MKDLKKSLEAYKEFGDKQLEAFKDIFSIISFKKLKNNKAAYDLFVSYISGFCSIEDLLEALKANKIIPKKVKPEQKESRNDPRAV